jgi:hypothetical protein
MKLLHIVPVVLGLAAGVAFADGSGSAAPSGGAVSDADVKRFLAFWDKLVDVAVADKDNCPKMGTDLNALIDANKDVIAAADKARAAGKQLPADAAQHVKDGATKFAQNVMGCAKDATVKGAMQRLSLRRQN